MKNILYKIECNGVNAPTSYVIAPDPTTAVTKLTEAVRALPGCEYKYIDIKCITIICDGDEFGDFLVI